MAKNIKLSDGLVHTMPGDLAEAFAVKDSAVGLWDDITPIARNEFLCWIDNAKQQKTRDKRIRRTIEELLEGQRRPCCWAGCIHRSDKKPSTWQQNILTNKKPR